MVSTVEVRCAWCEQPFTARIADRKRGWAKCCSKACKASKQQFGYNKAFWESHNPNNKKANITKYAERLLDDHDEDWGHPMAAGFEGHGQN